MVLKKSLVMLFLILPGTISLAQKIDQETQQRLHREYPEDPVIYLYYYQDVDISVEGDSLIMENNQYEHRVYLGEQGSMFAKDEIYTNSFYKLGEVEAYSLIPDGKRYDKREVSDFKESSNLDSYVFYDDSRTLSFIYPGIQTDAHSVLKYSEQLTEPRFGTSFFFQTFIPIDHARFRVTVDAEVDVDFSVFHLDDFPITRSEETNRDGRTVYIFEGRKLGKRRRESSAPRINYYVPHVVLRVKEFQTENKSRVSVLQDTDDLYAWYREFIGDIATRKDPAIQQIVDDLIEPGDTEKEKVRKIFYWVQENIKYIAFEDGMRGFVPHPGAYVCDKRYGDCKDMASIIVNMLHHAGIKAYFTWIGTRNLPYRYTELPTPMVDNHMIATYEADGEVYFLDATAQYQSFPYPSSMIQGKEALIGKGESYEIVRVPVIPAEKNVMNDTIRLKITANDIKGKGKVHLSGYARTFNAYKLIKSDENNVEKYLTRLLAKGHNKFIIDTYDISNLYDLDKPIEVDYSFTLSDYHREINDEIYINLNMDKSFQNSTIDNTRELPIENDYQYVNKTVSILEIPEEYEASYLPADVDFNNDVFSFSIRYSRNNQHEIVMDKTFRVKYLLLTPGQFEAHNEAVKELTNAYREAIILGKKEKQ